MSLDALVAEAGQVLGDARKMFGPAPTAGGWSSTPALSAGKDSLAQAGGVLAGWGGASATTHLSASGGRVVALDNVIGADRGTAPGFTGAAQTSQSGGGGMDDVNADTRRGVAAIAPSTDTPAGKTQLVNHLQSQLDRAKALLKVSESRNVMLANAIRGAAGGYGGGMPMGGGMGGPMGGGMPMGGGGMGGGGLPGLGGAGLIPNLSAFTRNSSSRRGTSSSSASGLNLRTPVPSGPGAEAFRAAVRHALDIKGITNPRARAYWENGMMVVADRESDFNNRAVNNSDSNAQNGDPSAGTLQFIKATFDAYHEPGTSTDRSDNVAQAAAFINYAMGRYGVSPDGHDLAAKIQQADPTRPPKGY
ncbi:transglycosylase SLT domain-containing protein [Mycobacteroides abscessus subsp. abscessus]|nr:transglycosylase SLT domain-containing protein [Mycobacteroides abscessus subsp. abscessus]